MLTAGQILQLIRDRTCSTRKELIEFTGLSRSTVTDRVDRLIEAGYIHESGVASSGGGPPPSVLDIDATSRLALVADLGARHARVALTDLAARPLAEEHVEMRIESGPETGPTWARQARWPCPGRSGAAPPGARWRSGGRPGAPPRRGGWSRCRPGSAPAPRGTAGSAGAGRRRRATWATCGRRRATAGSAPAARAAAWR